VDAVRTASIPPDSIARGDDTANSVDDNAPTAITEPRRYAQSPAASRLVNKPAHPALRRSATMVLEQRSGNDGERRIRRIK
jgi:hypothetical protein